MEQLERIVEQCIDEIRTDRLTEERLIELREAIREWHAAHQQLAGQLA